MEKKGKLGWKKKEMTAREMDPSILHVFKPTAIQESAEVVEEGTFLLLSSSGKRLSHQRVKQLLQQPFNDHPDYPTFMTIISQSGNPSRPLLPHLICRVPMLDRSTNSRSLEMPGGHHKHTTNGRVRLHPSSIRLPRIDLPSLRGALTTIPQASSPSPAADMVDRVHPLTQPLWTATPPKTVSCTVRAISGPMSQGSRAASLRHARRDQVCPRLPESAGSGGMDLLRNERRPSASPVVFAPCCCGLHAPHLQLFYLVLCDKSPRPWHSIRTRSIYTHPLVTPSSSQLLPSSSYGHSCLDLRSASSIPLAVQGGKESLASCLNSTVARMLLVCFLNLPSGFWSKDATCFDKPRGRAPVSVPKARVGHDGTQTNLGRGKGKEEANAREGEARPAEDGSRHGNDARSLIEQRNRKAGPAAGRLISVNFDFSFGYSPLADLATPLSEETQTIERLPWICAQGG
ncbi:uncharacterized protein CLUP02_13333 [Colletotrichum lupini]|uniref:Uncharacterized protein n=1 Tax=Colletotrichum lupini TaxID=145971 RepID=A0A9Q8T2P5_9PEZI|nr:uncharacterized protein CLUP02_13333 [Colletotrichum lupini]UQC87813.1 hypothetical protein CLUP02_13333 [Colletotrichum lupini]